ncbi:MAG: hypothetical protein WDN02_00735 [Methylovirgula sp.]|uniref:hypothetical protein n=1 Tax=Methylovirgula sp. TaxID=1978224 RepID=UPI0030764C37
MPRADAETEKLREFILRLEPSGPNGFEGLLAAVLSDVLKAHFTLAKSGSQAGRDGDSALSDQAIKFEAKLYKGKVEKDQFLSKLAEISANEQGQTDLWVLCSTGPVAAQDVQLARNVGRNMGIGVLVFDWSSIGLPSLPTLLALAPNITAEFLNQKLGEDDSTIRAAIAAIEAHPQFADRSEELKIILHEPSLAPAYARNANEGWLRAAFESANRARQVFGQALAPDDSTIARAVDRTEIREECAKKLSAAPDSAIVALLGVDGSGKSWLFAQAWLAQPEKVLTLVLVPGDFTTALTKDALEDLLVLKCIAQTGESGTETVKARWRRYFKRWQHLGTPSRPTLLVYVDGLNERSNLPWDRILDTLNGLLGDIKGKLAMSCRTAFYRERLDRRLISIVEPIEVPEWSQAELTGLLSALGIDYNKLTQTVADSLRNPRIFAVASRLLSTRQIEQISELSVSRLLFEHLRSANPGVDVPSPARFVRGVREHADLILKRLQKQCIDDLTVFDPMRFDNELGSDWNQQFDAASAGRFFEPLGSDPTLYRLKDDGLPLALGLALRGAAQKAERNERDLDEELSRILDPIAALDKTSDVLHAAIVAAVLDSESSDDVAAALIRAFVGLQNVNSGCYPEFYALARNRPAPFLMALELTSLRQALAPNFSWLTKAASELREAPSCRPVVDSFLHRWLNFFSDSPTRRVTRFGLTSEQYTFEIEKKEALIQKSLAGLSEAERSILEELRREERGDYADLSTIAFHLLAGKPLAPFARSLRNWEFADQLNGSFIYTELPNLLAFNRVDWTETRAALLKEMDDLKGIEVSDVGQWTRAALMRATGGLEDAKEADELIEKLTRDRPKFPGWRLIENYCASDPCDPCSERPSNIDGTIQKYRTLDFSRVSSAAGPGPEQTFFQMAMVGLARFEPEAVAGALHRFSADVLTRDGTSFRYGVFSLEDHTAALDDSNAIQFASKAATLTAEALSTGDEHKQIWISTQHALLIAFPHMSGDEQLGTLVSYPDDDNISIELAAAMRPCDKDRFRLELQNAINNDNM